MNIESLREYIVFAKHLNFSRAAAELNMTQSTLSKHIAAIESELGFDVVSRGRQLAFTEQGKELLASAQKVVQLYDSEIGRIKGNDSRPVRLRCSGNFLMPFLASLHNVPFTFVEAISGESTIAALQKGRADVDFNLDISINPSFGKKMADNGVAVVPCLDLEMGILVPKENELAAKPSLAHEDLRGRSFTILDGAYFDDLSVFQQLLLGEDLALDFTIASVDGNIANLNFMDMGSSLFFFEKATLEAICRQRNDVVMFDSVDGVSLKAPTALFYLAENSNRNVRTFIDHARTYYASTAAFR